MRFLELRLRARQRGSGSELLAPPLRALASLNSTLLCQISTVLRDFFAENSLSNSKRDRFISLFEGLPPTPQKIFEWVESGQLSIDIFPCTGFLRRRVDCWIGAI